MEDSDSLEVFDFGGSIVAPDGPDIGFLRKFLDFLTRWLHDDESRRLIMVVGGGSAARAWQKAARELAPDAPPESLDWIGIMATRLNAELVRTLLGPLCPDPVVINPMIDFSFTGRVLMAAGWKPGFSTDYDAVVLAERFKVRRILMLSDIAQVYSADPKIDPDAQAMTELSWSEYRDMTGCDWTPGTKLPFDPVAAAQAAKGGLTIIAASGRDLRNLEAILSGSDFIGTTIGS